MKSTMQDAPLLLSGIIRHGETIYADKRVFTVTPEGVEEATFFQIAKRAEQLASALERLGISRGDRVATFMWNNQAHMEAYLAVPSMGSVLHTLNIRLFPEQLAFIINHAEDRVIIVDASLAPLLARVRDQIPLVEAIIVHGDEPTGVLGETLDYDTLLAAERPGYEWPNSTNVTRRSCVTPLVPLAIQRVWCTRTARPGSTRWPRRAPTRWACASVTGVS